MIRRRRVTAHRQDLVTDAAMRTLIASQAD
jgi:hypothetical protein